MRLHVGCRPCFNPRIAPATSGLLRRTFQILVSLALLAGCARYPIITTPQADGEVTGIANVTALSTQLAAPADTIKIILIHGMSAHCPGYSLTDWLTPANAAAFGLQRKAGDQARTDVLFNTESAKSGVIDVQSNVTLTRMTFTSVSDGREVEISEITWSQLEQWLKVTQLHEDASGPTVYGCDGDQTTLPPPKTLRPSRTALTTLIKEGILDASLSDALIYVGSFGPIIERTVAQALCRIAADVSYPPVPYGVNIEPCVWPAPEKTERTRFVFFTHSQGSRIVLDVLLELSGVRVRPDAETFQACERDAAKPTIDHILRNTSSLYLFANQWPLLGLAYAPRTIRSDDSTIHPLFAGHARSTLQAAPPDLEAARTTRSAAFSTPLDALGLLIQNAAPTPVSPPKMDIVAFSDPNDLLSYGIPYRYTSIAGPGIEIDITNVYVHNAFSWFGLGENPIVAHTGYFATPDVQNSVRCGIKAGRVEACQP